MASTGLEDKIEQFRAITGADEATATTFLRGAGGDADRAVNEFFDDPGKYLGQNTYDENAWHTDRSGDIGGMGHVPAFNIETVEGRSWHAGLRSTAPSRPPSRASENESISSTRGIADTSDNYPMYQSQELGVIHGPQPEHATENIQYGPHFQPATRQYYDNSQWSMTLHSSANQSVVEVIPDPAPSKRRRKEGQPVFMKPLTSGDLLPAFITIMYAIPLARRALVLDDNVLGDYGFDTGWWRGTPIKLSSVTHNDSDHSGDSGFVEDEENTLKSADPHDKTDIIREAQRLMAFQAGTERSYGSVDVLAAMLHRAQPISSRAQTLCDKFLVQWEHAAGRLIPGLFEDHHLFQSSVFQQIPGQERPSEEHFWCLEVRLGRSANGEQQSLYEALDEMIWTDPSNEQAITTVAPVLVVKVTQQDSNASGLNMDVPAEWYVDRYLRENLDATKVMRQNVARCQAGLKQIDEKREGLLNFSLPRSGKSMDIKAMLNTAKLAFDRPRKRKFDDDDGDGEDEDMEDQVTSPSSPTSSRDEIPVPEAKPGVIAQLEAIASHIDRKLERLEQERVRLQAELQHHASLFKGPPSKEDDQTLIRKPRYRYSLCGAAIDSRTMFVLDRAPPSLIDTSDSDSPVTDQWWRFGYSNDPLVSKQRSTEDVVLGAASSGSREVLLVYASDEAIEPRQLDGFAMPEPLGAFVARDNEAFRAEEEQEVMQEAQDIAPLTGWSNDADTFKDGPVVHSSDGGGFVHDDGMGSYDADTRSSALEQIHNERDAIHAMATGVMPSQRPLSDEYDDLPDMVEVPRAIKPGGSVPFALTATGAGAGATSSDPMRERMQRDADMVDARSDDVEKGMRAEVT